MITVTGNGPDHVGDLPSITISYQGPPSAPAAGPSSVMVDALKPDGSHVTATAATHNGDGTWTWTAAEVIDQPHTWRWRVTAAGPLIDVSEFAWPIKPSLFP